MRPPVTLDSAAPPPPDASPEACPACGSTEARPGERCPACGFVLLDPRLGTLVAGRYHIDALLGRGGMGRVYRGRHLELDEAVAVKFLLPEFAANLELRQRFRREAVVLARLRHPGIVTVLDFGEDGGELYLVMELLAGRTLEGLVPRDGATLAVERLAAILDPVLQVLEVAHAAGVVHRDMKPENVMLLDGPDAPLRVKVLDFGLAFARDQGGVERLTAAGVIRGTPYYMSPEQCTGREVGAPSDVYAVGVMLYELLAGVVPFDGSSPAEVLAQQMFAQPPRFAALDPPRRVPAGLEALVLRAMAKRPEERPTAGAFRAELAAAVGGRDPATRAARDAAERARVAGLSREGRALAPGVDVAPEATAVASPSGVSPRVLLWGFAAPRAAALRVALAVHGVVAERWEGAAPPGRDPRGPPPRAALLAGDARAEDRTRALRAAADWAALPVIVLDTRAPGEAPPLIRAGASDVALDRLDDAAICQKVLRALRRGR